MLKLFILSSLLSLSDSTQTDTTKQQPSVLFLKSHKTLSQQSAQQLKYKHQQGFFCDFEDRINKNKKLNLNIGVGDQ